MPDLSASAMRASKQSCSAFHATADGLNAVSDHRITHIGDGIPGSRIGCPYTPTHAPAGAKAKSAGDRPAILNQDNLYARTGAHPAL